MIAFTWDGTEASLERLMIWWVKVYMDYEGKTAEELLDEGFKCFGPPKGNAIVGIEANATKHREPLPIYFQFLEGKRAGQKYDVQPGDTFLFEDGKYSYLESHECVVISQDWP